MTDMNSLIPRPPSAAQIASHVASLVPPGKEVKILGVFSRVQTFIQERVTPVFSHRHQAFFMRYEARVIQKETTVIHAQVSDKPAAGRPAPSQPQSGSSALPPPASKSSELPSSPPASGAYPPSLTAQPPQQVPQPQGAAGQPQPGQMLPQPLLPKGGHLQTGNLSLPQNSTLPQIAGAGVTHVPAAMRPGLPNSSKSASPAFLSPASLSSLISQVKSCEHRLNSPDFSTKANLILEGGQTLLPQTTELLHELSHLETVFKQLEKEQPHGFSNLSSQLGRELKALQTATLQTLMPPSFTLREASEKCPSFLNCQEQLLKQAENQLQPRLTELKKQLDPFVQLLSKEPGEKEGIQKVPLAPSVHNAKGATQNTQTPQEGKSLPKVLPYPASLQLATRVSNRTELGNAIKGVQAIQNEIKKRESANPLIIVPCPIEKKTDEIKSFEGKKTRPKEELVTMGEDGEDATSQPMIYVPEGTVLLGDPFKEGKIDELPLRKVAINPFLIAVVPITVAQYTSWLNMQIKAQKLILKAGVIYNREKQPLAKTKESSLTSFIETRVKQEQLIFTPLSGCDELPMTEVSWYGAAAFCETYDVRLPFEAEWERAAGMQEEEKKTRFGFGLDLIDPSLANYQYNRALPVGFYNGESSLIHEGKELLTQNAVSPWGCYDMSGNVREWTATPQNHRLITKGGSYLTTAFELRVSARLSFNPEEMLPDLGFRTVMDA